MKILVDEESASAALLSLLDSAAALQYLAALPFCFVRLKTLPG